MSERVEMDITYQEQLDRWAGGESVHRSEGGCCPDFSCCKPELAADLDVRRAFVAAGEGERMAFLRTFFQAGADLACREREERGGGRVRLLFVGAGEAS